MKKLIFLFLLCGSFSPLLRATNVTITTTTLPNGTIGVPYSATVTASGGCVPYRWVTGPLPTGVVGASNTRSLVLSGIPTKAATYPFSVTVTGCGNKSSTRNYTVTIQPAAVHTVTLTWNESDTSVVGYNMYRGTTSGGTYTKVNTGGLIAAMLYTDSTVANGTTYYYVVTAVDNTGAESAYSNQAQATIPN